MHQVLLSDQLYQEVARRATSEGFPDVDAYVATVLESDLSDNPENLDHLFTPEVLAGLDRTCAELDAGGKTYTREEVMAHFEERRRAWLSTQPD